MVSVSCNAAAGVVIHRAEAAGEARQTVVLSPVDVEIVVTNRDRWSDSGLVRGWPSTKMGGVRLPCLKPRRSSLMCTCIHCFVRLVLLYCAFDLVAGQDFDVVVAYLCSNVEELGESHGSSGRQKGPLF